MSLPTLDKVLVCLLILLTAAIWSESARAEPAPINPCDNECRERRFHQKRVKKDGNVQQSCTYYKHRSCLRCHLGLCSPNMVEDTHTAGLCLESTIILQVALVPSCNAMCVLPPEPPAGGDLSETAEQPGQYAGLMGWIPVNSHVHKCFVRNDAKSWGDETDSNGDPIKWKKLP